MGYPTSCPTGRATDLPKHRPVGRPIGSPMGPPAGSPVGIQWGFQWAVQKAASGLPNGPSRLKQGQYKIGHWNVKYKMGLRPYSHVLYLLSYFVLDNGTESIFLFSFFCYISVLKKRIEHTVEKCCRACGASSMEKEVHWRKSNAFISSDCLHQFYTNEIYYIRSLSFHLHCNECVFI